MRILGISLAILALGLASTAALAEADLGVKGVGAHLDYVDPEGGDGVIGFGGLVELGTIAPNIHLEGNVDYWSDSQTVVYSKVSIRDIAIGGTVTYYFAGDPNAPMQYYAGGGLGLHMLNAKATYDGPYNEYFAGEYDNSDTKLGIDLVGGTRYALSSPFELLGELRYRLVSDSNQFELRAGAVYKLGK
jgi:opacity protein-like surface antigen